MTRTPGSCSDCGEWQPKLSRGRCVRCYARWHRAQKKAGTFVRLETKQPNGCIFWGGHVSEEGYGKIAVAGTMHGAHRVAYELLVGAIPEGAWIDHACHNRTPSCEGGNSCLHRRCVNPEHLEPVTAHENQHRSSHTNASKDQCRNGHPFNEENTYIRPDTGARMCRECQKLRYQETVKNRQPRPPRAPKETCRNGHRMTPENTELRGNRRICRECRRDAGKRSYWRAKAGES